MNLFVGQVVHAHGGVDAGDPERSEIAFAGLAVPVGVAKGAVKRPGSCSEELAAAAAEAPGELEHFLASMSGFESTFDTHGVSPLKKVQKIHNQKR